MTQMVTDSDPAYHYPAPQTKKGMPTQAADIPQTHEEGFTATARGYGLMLAAGSEPLPALPS